MEAQALLMQDGPQLRVISHRVVSWAFCKCLGPGHSAGLHGLLRRPADLEQTPLPDLHLDCVFFQLPLGTVLRGGYQQCACTPPLIQIDVVGPYSSCLYWWDHTITTDLFIKALKKDFSF